MHPITSISGRILIGSKYYTGWYFTLYRLNVDWNSSQGLADFIALVNFNEQ